MGQTVVPPHPSSQEQTLGVKLVYLNYSTFLLHAWFSRHECALPKRPCLHQCGQPHRKHSTFPSGQDYVWLIWSWGKQAGTLMVQSHHAPLRMKAANLCGEVGKSSTNIICRFETSLFVLYRLPRYHCLCLKS